MVEVFFPTVIALIFTHATAHGLCRGSFRYRGGVFLVERRDRPVEFWLVMVVFALATLLLWGFVLDRALRV